ncbi:MAG: hypothetical protein EB127_26270 [Alphaproteobacteria bacterium]|nr:hypothetical protein [Alphaproteobacteria bacterium]
MNRCKSIYASLLFWVKTPVLNILANGAIALIDAFICRTSTLFYNFILTNGAILLAQIDKVIYWIITP